uniref:Reverse transcriptase n=1 Tax=Gongylonema pulchrum TaxID=637853 RepID=A0A183DMG0_9BILA
LHAVMPMNFCYDSKIWQLIGKVLNFNMCFESVVKAIKEGAREGRARYHAFVLCVLISTNTKRRC